MSALDKSPDILAAIDGVLSESLDIRMRDAIGRVCESAAPGPESVWACGELCECRGTVPPKFSIFSSHGVPHLELNLKRYPDLYGGGLWGWVRCDDCGRVYRDVCVTCREAEKRLEAVIPDFGRPLFRGGERLGREYLPALPFGFWRHVWSADWREIHWGDLS